MLSLNEAIRECIAQQDKDQIQMNEELMNDVCRDVLGNNKEYKDSKVQEKVTEIVLLFTRCATSNAPRHFKSLWRWGLMIFCRFGIL